MAGGGGPSSANPWDTASVMSDSDSVSLSGGTPRHRNPPAAPSFYNDIDAADIAIRVAMVSVYLRLDLESWIHFGSRSSLSRLLRSTTVYTLIFV
jgi:hypothetical protein